MKKTVFEYQEYKSFLSDWLRNSPGGGRGMKRKIAEHIRCQTAYVSMIFNGGAHLSMEHAEQLCSLLMLGEEEKRFFLLLVQHARAGTPGLREFVKKEMDQILQARLELKNTIKDKMPLNEEQMSVFFSAWYYAATYTALSIKACQTKPKLVEFLGLPEGTISEALDFMIKIGLVEQQGDRFVTGSAYMYLSEDSPMRVRHHANWRLQALSALDVKKSENLHYSFVFSVSEDDRKYLRKYLVDVVKEINERSRSDRPEKLYAVCLDYFDVID